MLGVLLETPNIFVGQLLIITLQVSKNKKGLLAKLETYFRINPTVNLCY